MPTVPFTVKATIPRDRAPKTLVADYDAEFGGVSERARFAYVQVWP